MPERLAIHKQNNSARKRDDRRSAHKRGYGKRWQRESKLFLSRAEHRLCVECNRRQQIVVATCVDHIKPHRGNHELFWDVSNWQGLCVRCHNTKTGKGQ